VIGLGAIKERQKELRAVHVNAAQASKAVGQRVQTKLVNAALLPAMNFYDSAVNAEFAS